jgi:hypothetical protein
VCARTLSSFKYLIDCCREVIKSCCVQKVEIKALVSAHSLRVFRFACVFRGGALTFIQENNYLQNIRACAQKGKAAAAARLLSQVMKPNCCRKHTLMRGHVDAFLENSLLVFECSVTLINSLSGGGDFSSLHQPLLGANFRLRVVENLLIRASVKQ